MVSFQGAIPVLELSLRHHVSCSSRIEQSSISFLPKKIAKPQVWHKRNTCLPTTDLHFTCSHHLTTNMLVQFKNILWSELTLMGVDSLETSVCLASLDISLCLASVPYCDIQVKSAGLPASRFVFRHWYLFLYMMYRFRVLMHCRLAPSTEMRMCYTICAALSGT